MDQQTPPQPSQSPAIARDPAQVIVELRARVNAGQPLSRDQVREALAALRQNRLSAAESPAKAKKVTAPVRSASDLLASLKGNSVQQ